jgi:hypothetical protein
MSSASSVKTSATGPFADRKTAIVGVTISASRQLTVARGLILVCRLLILISGSLVAIRMGLIKISSGLVAIRSGLI